ncbi:MAG: hypothetical protein IBX46_10420, partial [Desulfuromonadales bacterium]|nr:hypothetical protein [Desulfuromonadales bacterium]
EELTVEELTVEELTVEELDPVAEIAAPMAVADAGADKVDSSVINIDFDFSQFEDDEAEIEVDLIETLEPDRTVTAAVEPIELISTGEPDTSGGVPWLDLLPSEELPPFVSSQEETVQPDSPGHYYFPDEIENEAAKEQYIFSEDAGVEDFDLEILDEIVEDEILELEPLEEAEEEAEEEDHLSAEFAALEDLLATEMEEPAEEQIFDFDFTVEQKSLAAAPVDDDFFDLAAEILNEGALQATEDLANVDDTDRFRFDSVFSEFKKGVDAQIDQEDTEAHYDLGIAYKEMGLKDDAIEEFKKSMRSPKRLADSLILIGICYAEKGAFAEAETVFTTAISRPEVQAEDKIGTQYELALVYEVWGRPDDALRTFEAVAVSDPCFRNVGDKIETLRLQVSAGAGQSTGGTPGAASPGKDRISFV